MSLVKKIIIIVIVVVILVIGFLFFFKNQTPKDLSKVSDEEIIELLKKNEDSNNYMNNYKDFMIQDKLVLTPQNILDGQTGQNFEEVYQGLELEENRYLKVDLINSAGDRGLIAVLDLKTKTVPKAYGLILLMQAREK